MSLCSTILGLAMFAAEATAQITGTVTSSDSGMPIADALVMGEGLNWARTDATGRYSLPFANFRGGNAGRETIVSFRAKGYLPLTELLSLTSTNVDAQLQIATEWQVPVCSEVSKPQLTCGSDSNHKTPKSIGSLMQFTLPCNAKAPSAYHDVDYSGEIVQYVNGKEKFYLRTMSGSACCSGQPLRDTFLSSKTFSERAWTYMSPRQVKPGDEVYLQGLDARGTSKDGTLWRWVGPLIGEMAQYSGANEEAAKYFDSILDSMCIQARQ